MRARRRLRAEIALAFVLACLVVPAGVADVHAAANPLTLSVRVGYGGMLKLGQWMPVTVDATNTGAGVDGTLEVEGTFGAAQGGPPTADAIYEMPISLATGATKHLRTYIVEDQPGMTVTARIVNNGRILASQNAPTANVAIALVGVLSDQATALDSLAAVHPEAIVASVAHLSAADLSDSAVVLRAFDLLAVDDFATDTLTAGQRAAITDYVQTGGALLIGTGASWHKTLAGLDAGILPMTLGGTTTLGSGQALAGLDGLEAATGTVTQGQAWLADGDRPLLIERAVGTGYVTLATFDWNQEPIASWSGTSALLRQVLVRTALANVANQNFPSSSIGSISIAQRSNQLTAVLGNLPSLGLPSMWLTGVLVLLYVLLVGPVNYIVLRILNRRALAWVTVPLIAVVAAGGAYGAGVLTKGRSVQTNQVSIIHVQPGWDRAYAETYTGVLTPTRGDYQAGVGGANLLVSPIYTYNNPYGAPSSGVIRVNLDSGAVGMPGMIAFTLRGFATEGLTAAPHLTGTLRLVNGQLTGTIQNLSATDFSDAVVIAGDGFQKLGALRAGASAAVTVTPKASSPFGGPPGITTIYPNYSYANGPPPNQPSAALREGETRTQILTMLPIGASFKGVSSPIVPFLVAWTKQSFQPVTVNGSQPIGYAETAVAVQLPVDQIGAGSLPAGIVVGRMVDINGDSSSQQPFPGALSMTSGSVTYEFMPNLAAGVRLTGASLSTSNPYLGKGIPPTGTGVPSVTGQVWDWTHSTWLDFSYQDTAAANSIPDAAVNQSTGEVRLKLTVVNGGSVAGGISLAGVLQ